MNYVFSNIRACFVIDDEARIVEERTIEPDELLNFYNKSKNIEEFFVEKEQELIREYKNNNIKVVRLLDLNDEKLKLRLLRTLFSRFKNNDFFKYSRSMLFKITAQKLKSVDLETLIIQNVETLEQLTKTLNIIMKRIREYLVLKNPKLNNMVSDNLTLLDILTHKKQDKYHTDEHELSTKIKDDDIFQGLVLLADSIRKNVDEVKQRIIEETNTLMPETSEVATPIIASKLLMLAGGFKRLATTTSSFIQLLGAEKALFRHLRTGSKPPKYGILYQHPLVLKADKRLRGKVARKLALKISLALKKDYFRGV